MTIREPSTLFGILAKRIRYAYTEDKCKETGGMDMVILRFLLKLLTLPLLLVVDIALLITKASLWLSEVVVGLGIWICIIVGLFCLFDGLYPCAIAFGVMLLLIFIGLFAACVIEYFFESVRGALKQI